MAWMLGKRDHFVNWILMHIFLQIPFHESDTKPKLWHKTFSAILHSLSVLGQSLTSKIWRHSKEARNVELAPLSNKGYFHSTSASMNSLTLLALGHTHARTGVAVVASVDRIDLTWGVGKAWKLLDRRRFSCLELEQLRWRNRLTGCMQRNCTGYKVFA